MSFFPSYIPSPDQGVWQLGPVPIRAYALCILTGIFVAVWLGNKRWIARGGLDGQVADIAMWAVPFGVIGGRMYHVATDWELYFSEGGKGISGAFRVWEGGLGIWGAVLFGSVGVWIGARRKGLLLPPIADALAPGLAVAQAIGRWGNWFNQELFGRPTTLPWGLQIDAKFRPNGYTDFAIFHPTFLYECLWCLAAAAVVVWADRRFRLGHGRVFALYIAIYCLGRGAIESLRIDTSPELLGLRWNVWVAVFVGIAALLYVVLVGRLKPGREESMNRREAEGEFAHE